MTEDVGVVPSEDGAAIGIGLDELSNSKLVVNSGFIDAALNTSNS